MMTHSQFDLSGKNVLITGAAGLLGPKHAEAVLEFGASVILTDVDEINLVNTEKNLKSKFGNDKVFSFLMNVTSKHSIQNVMNQFEKIDVLINNAAKDPKVKKDSSLGPETRFELMTEEYWKDGLDAIINGTFLCSQAFCNKLLSKNHEGVIVNIASDLSVIAPDQRIYRNPLLADELQNVKPITYSAAKWAIVGMTKYLATYFAKNRIRVNCLSPTGVYNNHPQEFVEKLSNIIPMNRMASIDEYKGAIVFLCSNASSYMTGHNMVIDGGKTVW
jgi:NAD(P)-dependent dehydrogenase (short-subunit alcohol dehydrogenase family)